MQDESPAMPGSLEYAVDACSAIGNRIDRAREQLGPTGGALISEIHACAYEDDTGFYVDMSGDSTHLASIIAIAIIKLSEIAFTNLQKKEKYLPPGNQTPFRKVAASITADILETVTKTSHDRSIDRPSGIITPPTP